VKKLQRRFEVVSLEEVVKAAVEVDGAPVPENAHKQRQYAPGAGTSNPIANDKEEAFPASAGQIVVLCIDDNDSGLNIRKLLLQSRGFRVLVAQDGPTGLAIVEGEHVDAVILDYKMPGMDGEEVATRLRHRHPHIPILLLSGFPGSVPESLLSIVDGFVEKGQPAARLIAEVERLTGAGANSHGEKRRRA
jgi:CheY-like chemotaxis protein